MGNLRKEELFCLTVQGMSTMERKPGWQKPEAAGDIASTGKRQTEMNARCTLLHSF